MLNLLFSDPIVFIIIAAMLVAAISVHEFFHAFAADKLGDPTPRISGRLTIHPLAHLDPLGTFLIFFAGFGWGKPVPFDPFNLRNPKKDSAIISFAGPLSNLLMAVLSSILLRLLIVLPSFNLYLLFSEILRTFIHFNLILCFFNLIPVHPLDGFKVVAGLMPKKYYDDWLSLAPYGIIFLILLIFPFYGSSPISYFISPIVSFFESILIPSKTFGFI